MSSSKKNSDDLIFNENFVDEAEPAPPPVAPPPPPSPTQPVVEVPPVEPEATVVPVVETLKDNKETDPHELSFTASTAVPAASGTIQSPDQGPSEPPGDDGEASQEKKGGRFSWLTLEPFKQYFNVDTKDVLERILNALKGPLKADFIDKIEANPDLYGPFWIATTLVFWTVVSSNVASYTNHDDKDGEWDGDYSKFIPAAALFYLYVFLLGLIVFFGLKIFKTTITLLQIWCVYGYALTSMLPAVLLMCICQAIKDDDTANGLTIFVALVGTVYSGGFLLMNFRKELMSLGNRTYLAIAAIAACHIFLGLFLAFYFH